VIGDGGESRNHDEDFMRAALDFARRAGETY